MIVPSLHHAPIDNPPEGLEVRGAAVLGDWQLFKAAYASMSPYAMGPKIRAFAEQRKIHPSIVLGRYQHDFKVFDNGRGIERSIN